MSVTHRYLQPSYNQGICSNNTFNISIGNPWYQPSYPNKAQKEEELSKREDFEFPYTGAEIAAALEKKASRLSTITVLDDVTLEAIYPNEYDREDAKNRVESLRRANDTAAKKLRKEAVPYAKAGTETFCLDSDDVNHFGLNDVDGD